VGPKPFIRWGSRFHTRRGNFEGENRPAQDKPGQFRQSIYLKRLSRGQHRYGVNADWVYSQAQH